MISPSPLRRCLVLLCYAAAIGLATGAWRDYRHGHQTQPFNRFQSVRLRHLTTLVSQAPTALTWANTRVEIDLDQRQLTLYQNQQVTMKAPVSIGQAEWRTPIGDFAVQTLRVNPAWQHPITQKAVPAGPDNPLGSRWIGFLEKDGYHIGIHGTNQEKTIGAAVSHGCVRMKNQDIQRLYGHLKIGTPVLVKP